VENRAGYLELLLRADATATTTMHIFPPPAVSRGMHLSVTVSIGRKVMAVGQAIQHAIYTTRSLKRDETAGYIRLMRAAGERGPDTAMRDAEGDGLESDGLGHLRRKSGGRLFRQRRSLAANCPLVSQGWKRPERLRSIR
jgi:hypothetical protein